MTAGLSAEHYARAFAYSGPRLAGRSLNLVPSGYWLARDRYFYLQEAFDGDLLVAQPMIAAPGEAPRAAVAPAALAALLKTALGRTPSADEKAAAELDMPTPDEIAISIADCALRIDCARHEIIEVAMRLDRSALYSPDGRHACVVKGDDLALIELASGATRPLTRGGRDGMRYGRLPETALTAVSDRRQPRPVGLWSASSEWFVTHCVDEQAVPEQGLVEHSPSEGVRPRVHRFRYAVPGDPLPIATLVARHLPSGRTVEFTDWPILAQLSPFTRQHVWFCGPATLCLISPDRFSRSVRLLALDLGSGSGRVLHEECVEDGHVMLTPRTFGMPNLRLLAGGKELICYSERSGRGHLILRQTDRSGERAITAGDYRVDEIVGVDEERRRVLFLASGFAGDANPARRALCAASLDHDGLETLIDGASDVFVAADPPANLDFSRRFGQPYAAGGISPDGATAAVLRRDLDTPGQLELVSLAGGHHHTLVQASVQGSLPPAQAFTLKAADGITDLSGVLFLPEHRGGKCPLIDYLYPGPQVAHGPRSHPSLHAAPAFALAELGIAAMMLDSRGVPLVSRAFHQAGYGELYEPQLADHRAAVLQLCERFDFLQRDRVGLFGQSAGAAAVVRGLCDYPDIFRVGAAISGNHDASRYASLWADTYCGPEIGRRTREPLATLAERLRGALFLATGDMDENVSPAHTLALVDALLTADKDCELLVVPNAGHDLFFTSATLQRRVWDFFVRALLDQEPPRFEARAYSDAELRRFHDISNRELRA